MDELRRTLSKKILPGHGLTTSESNNRTERLLSNMLKAFPEASVDDYESQMSLAEVMPDRNDRHVLAAAVRTEAAMIVTENLKDFPSNVLLPLNLEAKTADSFISDAISLDEVLAVGAVRTMRLGFDSPEVDAETLLALMERRGLVAAANELRPFKNFL